MVLIASIKFLKLCSQGSHMKKKFLSYIVSLIVFVLSSVNANITFQIKSISECTEQEIDQMADMRITYFREFPYLYEGSKEYELHYLNQYKQKAVDAYLVQAFDQDKLVGILTGCAFKSDIEVIRDGAQLFAQKELWVDNYYYIGEAIIIPEYQGRKILPQLIFKLGKTIRKLNKYQSLCFLTVIRKDDDSRKPVDYHSSDQLWLKLGCQKTDITCSFEWPTIMSDNSVQNILNEVQFWIYEPGLSGYTKLAKFIAGQSFKTLMKQVKNLNFIE